MYGKIIRIDDDPPTLFVGAPARTGEEGGRGYVGRGSAPALAYFDRNLDCNTPSSTSDGALDWMGVAHALDLKGAEDALCDALGTRPLLTAGRWPFWVPTSISPPSGSANRLLS